MGETLVALLGLLAATAVLWLRSHRVQRPAFRIALLVLAALLAYPAVNACYVGAKRFIASRNSR